MRRILFFSLALMAVLGFVAPPDVFAQAAAPQPKFTITGLIDNVGTWTQNLSSSDLNLNRNNDHQMYGRTRGRFDIIGEVGEAKGVSDSKSTPLGARWAPPTAPSARAAPPR
jgi:hypothetical protein